MSTLGTVGYGDIRAAHTLEMAFSIVVIILGVSFFTYFTGQLAILLADFTAGASVTLSISLCSTVACG